MSNVLLCFSEPDRKTADRVAEELAEFCGPVSKEAPFGLSPSEPDAPVNTASCVVVLWSQSSWSGGETLQAAARARDRGVLLSATLDSTTPSGFLGFPLVDLSHWRAEADDKQLRRLVKEVRRLMPPSPPSGSPSARDEAGEAFAKPERGVVFLCYRRDDTSGEAGRLYDGLAVSLGETRVFMDVGSTPLGVNFVSFINEQIQACSAVLVIIGRNWTTIADERGQRRLDAPADHVRLEIVAALKQGKAVIPILVQNASMPRRDDLPEDIRDLVFRNALKLSAELWKAGVDKLVAQLNGLMQVATR